MLYLFFALLGALLFLAWRNYRILRLIINTPISRIVDLRRCRGIACVYGRVSQDNRVMKAPLTGRSCVYYHFKVKRMREKGLSIWSLLKGYGDQFNMTPLTPLIKIIDHCRQPILEVEDTTGRAQVELAGAKLMLLKHNTRKLSSGTFKNAPNGVENILRERYSYSTKKFWIFKQNLFYTETIIEPGDHLYILGKVVDKPGGMRFQKSNDVFIVSNKGMDNIKGHYFGWFFLWIIITLMTVTFVIWGF